MKRNKSTPHRDKIKLPVQGNREHIFVFKNIVHLDAAGQYTEIYSYENGLVMHYTLSHNLGYYVALIKAKNLKRLHESHYINLDFVTDIDNSIRKVSLFDGYEFIYAKPYKKFMVHLFE